MPSFSTSTPSCCRRYAHEMHMRGCNPRLVSMRSARATLTRHSLSVNSMEDAKGAGFSSVAESDASGGTTVSPLDHESRRPCRRTPTAWRALLVVKESREVLQAQAEPGVAFLSNARDCSRSWIASPAFRSGLACWVCPGVQE